MSPISFNLIQPLACVAVALVAASASAQETAVLKTQQDKDSYAIGVDLARSLKRRGVQMETEALLQGVRDVVAGQKLLMTEDELRETIRNVQLGERRRQILAGGGMAPLAEDNAAKGAAFLAQNKTNADVVCLPSGLQYKILKAGNGQKPTASDTIDCRFRASLVDGRQFAGTDPAGPPTTLKLSEIIPGLREGLQLMPVGSQWQLFIPPQLGYGERGVGRSRLAPGVGPNATLIYEVELLAVK